MGVHNYFRPLITRIYIFKHHFHPLVATFVCWIIAMISIFAAYRGKLCTNLLSERRGAMGSKRPLNATIEKIRHRDLTDLEKIFVSAFGEEVHVDRIRKRVHRVRQFYYLLLPLSAISPWIKNLFNIYICRVDGVVAGFIQVSFLNSKQLHLDFIAVSKKFRGQGLGTWMLHELLKKSADNRNLDVILEVKLGNPAHHLYRRLGFRDQAQVLHYEKKIETAIMNYTDDVNLEGIRRRRDTDWRQLYQLYLTSIPVKLQQTMVRPMEEFNPSLFTRTLEWIKDKLMGNIRREFVIERQGNIIGSLEIYSYPNTAQHIMNIMLNPAFEHLRMDTVLKAFSLIKDHQEGLIMTTIYNDARSKQRVLEELGFVRTQTYCLMFRPPHPKRGRVVTYPVSQAHQKRTDCELSQNIIRSPLKTRNRHET